MTQTNNPTIYIYFNELSKIPAFYSLEKITTPLPFKEISLIDFGITDGKFNLARFRWDGDFDTGELVDLFLEKKAVVTEQDIDQKYNGMFFRRYSIEQVLYKLILNTDFHLDSEGGRMQEFLQKLMGKKNKELDFYVNSKNHILETREMQEERINNSFKL